jgi:exportin-T
MVVGAGGLFHDVLAVAVCVPQRLPRNKLLRSRFISYLHRMVECLGPDIVPFLPQALSALLHEHCDASDIVDVVRLVNQLMNTFPTEIETQLKELLPALIIRCAAFSQMSARANTHSCLHTLHGRTSQELRM